MPSPFVSTSGVAPSDLNSWKVVPTGKGVAVGSSVMLKVSVPVPVLVTTLVKLTVEPGLALVVAAGPVNVTAAVCSTVNETVPDVPVTVAGVGVAPLL